MELFLLEDEGKDKPLSLLLKPICRIGLGIWEEVFLKWVTSGQKRIYLKIKIKTKLSMMQVFSKHNISLDHRIFFLISWENCIGNLLRVLKYELLKPNFSAFFLVIWKSTTSQKQCKGSFERALQRLFFCSWSCKS